MAAVLAAVLNPPISLASAVPVFHTLVAITSYFTDHTSCPGHHIAAATTKPTE